MKFSVALLLIFHGLLPQNSMCCSISLSYYKSSFSKLQEELARNKTFTEIFEGT